MSSPRHVLARALCSLGVLLAVALVAVAAPASPASAAQRNDPLAAVAADALTHLQAVQTAAAADPTAPAAADLLGEWAAYQGDLSAAADLVAERSSVPAGDFVTAWTAMSTQRMTVVLSAISQLGVPYRFAGAKPGVAFDCSGLTMWAWAQTGVKMNHGSTDQIRSSSPRTFDTAQPGDLVEYPGHVMMYLGAGRTIIHSPHSGSYVLIRDFSEHRSVQVGSPIA